MYRLIHILGAPDNNRLRVTYNKGEIQTLRVIMAGNNTLNLLLDPDRLKTIPVTIGGVHPPHMRTLPEGDVILNSICDPDTNTDALLQAKELFSASSLPVVNAPEGIFKTTREMSYRYLKEVPGLVVPKCLRLTPRHRAEVPLLLEKERLGYPYIFRSAGEHGGGGMALIKGEDDLHLLEQFAFDGSDFYAIEFVDFQSEDKLYRKTRYFVIEGEVYFRHHIITDDWKIHAESRYVLMDDQEELRMEEKALVTTPTTDIASQCLKMYEILGLDFFGIDCHRYEDGTMLIFEINTCMNTNYSSGSSERAQKYDYLQESADTIQKALNTMIIKKVATRS